eukprot:TRINITY_DN13138_c0_g1_i4.p1 TRINITY_DN13138_c0_g1~~TRINITY_DN13138_c0_g1_i4.p1  ORF type:complete len:262 (-),score=27.54 TRINITY_DN13138_c0_g1_i4:797-1582(-)
MSTLVFFTLLTLLVHGEKIEHVDLYLVDVRDFCASQPPFVPLVNSSDNGQHVYVCTWGDSNVGFAFFSMSLSFLHFFFTQPRTHFPSSKDLNHSCSSSGCGNLTFDSSSVTGFSITFHAPRGSVMMLPGHAILELLWVDPKNCNGTEEFNVTGPRHFETNTFMVRDMWFQLGTKGSVDRLALSIDFDVLSSFPLPETITVTANRNPSYNHQSDRNCTGISNYALGPFYSWIRLDGLMRDILEFSSGILRPLNHSLVSRCGS